MISDAVPPALALPQNKKSVHQIEGVVQDQSGAAIAGAKVIFREGTASFETATDNEGRFAFNSVSLSNGTLAVSAQGFAELTKPWHAAAAGSPPVAMVLLPAPLSQKFTVTATRTPTELSETPADVLVLGPQDVSSAAALNLDDILRQVPGFTLFRRSSSRTANPTAQGVSLRGVGASGASRALVLADGVPLNDPFGGWIYWDRVPRAALERVEIVRGGASDLYGTSAMGGVINVITRQAKRPALSLETSYGNENTPEASLWTGTQWGPWQADLSAETMHTDGYIMVDPAERGRVDTLAGSEHETADLRIGRGAMADGNVFAEASMFRETKTNGTPLETNRTHLRQLVLGGDWQSASLGALSFRAYGGPQLFDQTFSAVADDRNSENLVNIQRVPAQQTALSGQWSRLFGMRQTVVAGVDGHEVRGASNETGFFSGKATRATDSGGRQRTEAIFGEDIVRLTSRWLVTTGVRFDHWRNFDALATVRPFANPSSVSVTDFPERTESAFSPRLATLYRVNQSIALTASAYRAFRAPTLNELYRNFRVGDIVTNANSSLLAERLTGAEAGVEFTALARRLHGRSTVFWDRVSNPIANVTLQVTPALITRQRQNLGRIRTVGADIDLTADLTQRLSLSAGYEHADAIVTSFSADPALVGLWVPQVPHNVFTFESRYSTGSAARSLGRWTLAFQGRVVGKQFDDDQNLLPLGRYFALDAFLAHPIGHGVEAFLAAENLFDERYAVGRTPVLTLGPPTLVRGGIRVNLPSR
jgi:outer membrane receptor protein involved in Fe transport